MQVFKAAVKIILKHPVYLLVYIVVLSTAGVLLVGSLAASSTAEEYKAERPTIAVIDRDNSELSQSIVAVLGEHADRTHVEDTTQALQDAVAQDVAHYILIIPSDYEKAFLDAPKESAPSAELETIVGYESVYGTLMDQVTNQYLSLVTMTHNTGVYESWKQELDQAKIAMRESAQVEVSVSGDATQASEAYLGFLKFSCYPLTCGIIVCVVMLMAAFNKADIRRRNLSSPLKLSSFNTQTALGCSLIALFAWAWISLLGFGAFSEGLAGVPVQNILLFMLIALVYVTVPLAFGFLFSQIGVKENVANAAGNILAMVLSVMGGAWMSLSLLGAEVVAVSRFFPTYWYSESIDLVGGLTSVPTAEILVTLAGNLGIILLFAAAIFVAALVVGKVRAQSVEAGGNRSAARSHT